MTHSYATKIIAAGAICMLAAPAFSHIVLETRSAPAGATYKAVFQIGHGCEGSATTGVTVQIPPGFQGAKPFAKAGWTASTKLGKLAKPYASQGKPVTEDVAVVRWVAAGKAAALQDGQIDEFALRGKLPEVAGPLWFKVLQTCESGSLDWSDIPASGVSVKGLKSPAVLLEVTGPGAVAALAPSGQPVQVSDAWVRATVPGQRGSGAFMKITAKEGLRLVGVSSPLAGVAEVHEMKMEDDIMKMRAMPVLELPAGKTVELKSGGNHVMLMDLKQPLIKGSTLPLTLRFKNAQGVESKLELLLPVSMVAPGPASTVAAGKPADTADEHSLHKR
ncbi:DUF1775 domain-containing protein [Polaromonas sp.]|uniref:DUF1775 domain-containing protein n=1 Tax=Polaromonas sp. TaxID=1869339 RepID=UPI00286B47B1|nr:DUF1775 domain-containing protein [Polaromonas sp.]